MNVWIKAEDSLPEDHNGNSKPVLVYGPAVDGGQVAGVWVGYYIHSLLKEWRLYGNPTNQNGKITHWMALPDAPPMYTESP